jgi:hypothetical protein
MTPTYAHCSDLNKGNAEETSSPLLFFKQELITGVLIPKSIAKLFHYAVMQAFWVEHLHIGHPGENPTNQLLATRCHHAQFDAPVSVSSDLLFYPQLPKEISYQFLACNHLDNTFINPQKLD